MYKKSFLLIIAILALLPRSAFCAETVVPSKVKILRQALDECEKDMQLAKKTDAPASTHKEKETPQAAPASTEEKSNAEKKNFWERVNIHGYYQNRNYFDRKKDNAQEHAYELRQDLRLESSQRLSERFSSFLSLDGQYDLVHNSAQGTSDEEKRFKLWECYLNYAASNLNLRLGRQVIRWGKSDEINPTDNFTPEDWTEYLNLTRAERKLPVWMTKLDYAFEPFNIEIIWLPFFEASRIPETGSDWEPYLLRQYNASGIPVGAPERPAQNLRNQVAALKVSKTTQDYDLSLSYAYHYDELPALHRDLVSIGPPPLFSPNYEVSQR
ncbi:MAG: hypothetical protein PHV55_05525, partial [Candidatus Omnitrophica bacterium]|nr:hypothetical protein [Candidatus Omnitrophota bacterium]